VTGDDDGGGGVDREPSHQRAELPDLIALDLVAEKYVAHGVDDDRARLQCHRFRMQRLEQRGHFDPAVAIELGQHGVFARKSQRAESTRDKIGKTCVVMFENGGEAAMDFVLLVFSAEIDRRAGLGK
jgi:hypothetical protein